MAVIHLDCPNCGAKLPPREATGRTRCEYCGANFEVAKTIHAQPPPTIGATPHVSKAPAAVALTASLFAAGIGVSVAIFAARKSDLPVSVSSLGVPGVGSWATIDSASEVPIVAAIDGRDHVFARIRLYPDDQLFIAAFDLDTGEERYRVGPLGSYTDGYRATHFEVVGERLLVTDHRSKLRVVDLATGAQQQELSLTDRAEQLCLLPKTDKQPAAVHVKQVDERELALDLGKLALREEKLPKACEAAAAARQNARSISASFRWSDDADAVPKIDGFEAEGVRIDGDLGVARGHKQPGTAYPMAAGFDPRTLAVRWKQPIAAVDLASVRERDNAVDGLAAGRYFATYGEGQETWHLAAFDAQSGARLWDSKLRGVFAVDWLYSLAATDTKVILQRMSSLEVYDAKTGELRTTIGKETYDD